jgi:hypothetical protein
VFSKYGRHGGFSDVVQGVTPYLYPITFGVDRRHLHRLIATHARVRSEIAACASQAASVTFAPGAFVVGVHYRGTDATHRWSGWMNQYRTSPVPYSAYADEVRRVVAARAPQTFQVFVATDEMEFLDAMRREFGKRVV